MTMHFVSSPSRARIEQAGMLAERARIERIKIKAADAARAEASDFSNKLKTAMSAREAALTAAFIQAAKIEKGWRLIARKVVCRSGVSLALINSSIQSNALCVARHRLMYALCWGTTLSLPQIGARLGGKDHTTVLSGVRRHAERNGLPLPRGMTRGRRR